jgi:hypothetical protein
MDRTLARRVRQRANDACEYCHMPQSAYRFRFPIDHVIAKQHRGKTSYRNLCLSCLHCNAFKGPNIAGIDPKTGELVRLYNPRQDNWHEHFRWRGARLLGLTPIGRATILVLNINDPRYLGVRRAVMDEGLFPL